METILQLLLYIALVIVGGSIILQALRKAGIIPKIVAVDRNSIGGANARNSIYKVEVATHEADGSKVPYHEFIARQKQEEYESEFKSWLWNLILTRFPRWRRKMELMGHAVEVASLPTEEQDDAFEREATALKFGYDGIFADMELTQIEAKLRALQGEAKSWLRKHDL